MNSETFPAQPNIGARRIGLVGASGFIGRAVSGRLEAAGHRVERIGRDALDRTLDGDPAPLIAALAGCDAVINCAGRAHVLAHEGAALAEERFMAVNRDLAQAIGWAARSAAVPRMIHVSSVAAIASHSAPGQPIDDDTPPAPGTPYGRSKLAGDEQVLALATADFLPAVLRPPAVFGPDARGWFPLFLAAARRGAPLPLGRIENRRSFAYVGNVADAIVHSIDGHWTGAHIVTDSEPMSSAAFYRLLLAAAGHSNRIWPLPAAVASWGARVLLGTRSSSLLDDAAYDGAGFHAASGWKPVYSQADAARLTLAGVDA